MTNVYGDPETIVKIEVPREINDQGRVSVLYSTLSLFYSRPDSGRNYALSDRKNCSFPIISLSNRIKMSLKVMAICPIFLSFRVMMN